MKKCLFLMWLTMACLVLQATPRVTDGDFYELRNMPRELKASIVTREIITFELEENGTTGYMWTAKYDDDECYVSIEHFARENYRMVGVPGRARITIKGLKKGRHKVLLQYVRAFEKQGRPAYTVEVNVHVSKPSTAVVPPPPPQPPHDFGPKPGPGPQPGPKPGPGPQPGPKPGPQPDFGPKPGPGPQPGPGPKPEPPRPGDHGFRRDDGKGRDLGVIIMPPKP